MCNQAINYICRYHCWFRTKLRIYLNADDIGERARVSKLADFKIYPFLKTAFSKDSDRWGHDVNTQENLSIPVNMNRY